MNARHHSNSYVSPIHDEADSHERIAAELIAEGLSGVAEEDTWILNARLDHHHANLHQRRRQRLYDAAG
jgi:hypothetical protein